MNFLRWLAQPHLPPWSMLTTVFAAYLFGRLGVGWWLLPVWALIALPGEYLLVRSDLPE